MSSIELTSVNLPERRSVVRWLRANLEWIGAGVAGLSAAFWRYDIAAQFASKSWDLGAYYTALFNWSSLQGAFLFGVYAFFLSRSEPFIQAIAPSAAFKMLRRYVVRTLYFSMALSALVLPMLVAPITMKADELGIGFVVWWIVTIMLVYTVLSFLKVVRVFGKIERRS